MNILFELLFILVNESSNKNIVVKIQIKLLSCVRRYASNNKNRKKSGIFIFVILATNICNVIFSIQLVKIATKLDS